MDLQQEVFDSAVDKIVIAATGRVRIALNGRQENVVEQMNDREVQKQIWKYDVLWITPNSNETVEDCLKRMVSEEIKAYDTSSSVNQFTLQGKKIWLPKETRVGLVNSINIEKAAGKSKTVLWFDGVRYEILIDNALQMLSGLELYALECYNITHKHLAEVEKLQTIEEIIAYDYKTGYPSKLTL